MTVASTQDHSGPFVGNGVTTVFPFDFDVRTTSEVRVLVDGVEQSSGYTVALTTGGGSVTFAVAPASGQSILPVANPAFEQETSFKDAGQFLASTHDDALDQAAIRDIYLRAGLKRSFRAPQGEEFGPLPAAALRAGTYLAFDAGGNPIPASGTGSDAGLRTDLATSAGSTFIAWIASGIGAVVRTIRDKLRERVSVKDFGAVGNGTADDTAAINNAAASLTAGGRLRFPEGIYKITAPINLPSVDGISFSGANRNKTSIVQATLTENIINTGTGAFFKLSGLRLTWSGTAAAGTKAIYSLSNYAHYDDFMVDGGDVAIHFKTGVAQKATNFDLFNSISSSVLIEGLNDVFLSKFIMNAGNTTNGANGVIRLKDKAEAVVMTDGDVLFGAYSIKTDASSYTQGNRPAHCKFNNIYFDSSLNGGLINNSVEFDFNNCSFSNRPNNGITLGVVDGIRFNGGAAIQCGVHGVAVGATAVRVVFNGFAARGNSYMTPNTGDGINIAAGATDFLVTNCILGGSIGFGTQRYGVKVETGASDRYIIADNLVTGNGTGGVLDGGSGSNKRVANNY